MTPSSDRPGGPQATPSHLQALFVHGMGRSPISGIPLNRRLQRAGLHSTSFGYVATLESFEAIRARLLRRVSALAARGDYVLIGHSLGGVLIRAVTNSLPDGTRLPRRLFLIGSPVRSVRLARALATNPLFRAVTRDCGQLLGSDSRMQAIGASPVPTTAIVGVRGFSWRRGPFGDEPNDGIVAVSEASDDWLVDRVQLPLVHTLMPYSVEVAEVILERCRENGASPFTEERP